MGVGSPTLSPSHRKKARREFDRRGPVGSHPPQRLSCPRRGVGTEGSTRPWVKRSHLSFRFPLRKSRRVFPGLTDHLSCRPSLDLGRKGPQWRKRRARVRQRSRRVPQCKRKTDKASRGRNRPRVDGSRPCVTVGRDRDRSGGVPAGGAAGGPTWTQTRHGRRRRVVSRVGGGTSPEASSGVTFYLVSVHLCVWRRGGGEVVGETSPSSLSICFLVQFQYVLYTYHFSLVRLLPIMSVFASPCLFLSL